MQRAQNFLRYAKQSVTICFYFRPIRRMTTTTFVNAAAIVLGCITLIVMISSLVRQRYNQPVYKPRQLPTFGLLAIIAFIADTLGIGSFPVVIAGCKIGRLLPDSWLPGLTNGAQLIPGIIESVLFLHIFHVDTTMLITFVSAACLGGIVGGLLIARMNSRTIQRSMLVAFILIAVAIFCKQIGWLSIADTATSLHGTKLILGFIGMLLAGMLTCVGVGIYSVTQTLLLLLGVAPWIAFPIMTTAGAFQQSFATTTLTLNGKVPLKPALLMTCVGIIGVLLALPLVAHMTANKLHWLLFVIIVYNAVMMGRTLYRHQAS